MGKFLPFSTQGQCKDLIDWTTRAGSYLRRVEFDERTGSRSGAPVEPRLTVGTALQSERRIKSVRVVARVAGVGREKAPTFYSIAKVLLFRVNGRPLRYLRHSSRYDRRGHWMSFYTGLPNRRLRWQASVFIAIAIAQNVPPSSFPLSVKKI